MDAMRRRSLIDTLIRLVEHRDQRRKYADSLESPMSDLERQQADLVLRAKFEEFVDALPLFLGSPQSGSDE